MLGRLIDDRYQVRSRIARGGMATVYLATDLRLERRVAVKVMHSHLADDSNFKTRFVQEARSTARLAHPNVVSVFDQGQDDDMAYLVMEYLPGITLRDLLRDYGRLTPEQTVDIMNSVLSGLAAAHRAGIVHRDLKPENVLLADDGRIKIGDFGLARAASKATGTGQALLGTIAYLSPELVTRGVADARSDIYAIGIMMYEMLTGEQPFQGEQPMQIAYQHANDSVPRPSLKNPLVPPQLDDLVLWATARGPEQRPKDAAALLEGLQSAEHAVHGDDHDATVVIAPPGEAAGATSMTALFTGLAVPGSTSAQTQLLDGTTPLGGTMATPGFAGPAAQVRAEASATDAVTRLARVGKHRRIRGWLLLLLVLVLAGGAAGTGWYYGNGPGALVAVPSLNGSSQALATSRLEADDFVVKVAGSYNLTVRKGVVIRSAPAAGAQLHKGDTVTLIVSKGANPVKIPQLAGQTQAAATKALTGLGDTVSTNVALQFGPAPKGTVISAMRTSDKVDFSKGGDAFKGQNFSLVVSAGQVPSVVGKPLAEAQSLLDAAGLNFAPGQQNYSDQYAKGVVMSAELENSGGGAVVPGDTYILDTSLGQQLFPVPNVVGMTLKDAKQTLTSQGFTFNYPSYWDALPDILTKINGQLPAAQTPEAKGTQITLSVAAG